MNFYGKYMVDFSFIYGLRCKPHSKSTHLFSHIKSFYKKEKNYVKNK